MVRAVFGGRPDPAGGALARRPFDVRRVGLALVGALLLEFLLGLATSLWVTLGPPAHPWSHISHIALFGAHGVIGIAIGAMALVALGRTVDAHGPVRLWALVGLVSVLVALACGLKFVDSTGNDGWSFGMGCGWAIAVFAYVRLASA
jgi:hypothetical protein